MKQDYKITQSEEYKAYIKALCTLSSQYVTRIRAQFCIKAYEMYQDKTVRRIVLAYGEEHEKLEEYRLMKFMWESEKEEPDETFLKDDVLNKANAYGDTIKMLFDII